MKRCFSILRAWGRLSKASITSLASSGQVITRQYGWLEINAGNILSIKSPLELCLWYHRRKWQSNRFVALKIATNNPIDKVTTAHEEDISRHITKANPKHEGYGYVRHILDSFGITGPDGMHTCLVFELLREPLWMFKQRGVGTFPPLLLKLMSPFILQGLDYLHTECHVIHTGKFCPALGFARLVD